MISSPKFKASPFLGMRSVRSPLIGRERELEIVGNLFEQIAVDQGQILGLVAPAGMGKSRMLLAISELAAQHSLPVYKGTFTQNYLPYEAFRQIVTQLAGSDADTLSRWEMTEAETDFLRLFLEPDAEIDRLKNLSESEIQQGLFYSVKKLMFAAAKTPVVFILEDAHWAGGPSQALLEYLIDQTETTRMLLVVAHRPDVEFVWKRRLNHTDVKLKPLEKIQIERFVRNVLDIDHLDTRVIHELVRVSHGNPLFLEEMLKYMLESAQIEIETEEDGARTMLLRTAAEGMPASLHTLIESRISRMPPASQEALRWATTLGSVGDTDELLAKLRQESVETADTALTTLFKEGFITERSAFPKRTYQFQHDLFFEVSQNIIPADEKRRRQKAWGDFLRVYHERDLALLADRVARHYLESDDEPSAIHFAWMAGKAALRFYHYTDAVYYLQEAYVRSKRTYVPGFDLSNLYVPLVETLLASGKLEESKEVLVRWERERGAFSQDQECLYMKLWVQYHDQRANHAEIIAITDRIKVRKDESPAFNQLYRESAHSRINAYVYMGKFDRAVGEGLEILRIFTAPEHHHLRMRLWGRLAYCNQVRGQMSVALDFVEKAEEYFNDQVPPLHQIELMFRVKNVYSGLDQHEQCRRIFSQMMEIAKRYGLRKAYIEAQQSRAELLCEIGQYSMGIQEASTALSESLKIKDYDTYFEAKTSLIDHLLDVGAVERAKSIWLQKESITPQYNRWQETRNWSIQAIFALFSENVSDAIRFFEEARSCAHQGAISHMALHPELYLIQVRCIEGLDSPESLKASFLEKTKHIHLQSNRTYFFQKVSVGYCLGAHGIDVLTAEEERTDPASCQVVDKKQRLYVWKIR